MALAPPNTARPGFDALYRSCSADVYAYVASLVRDRTTAEDVTSLAFERAYRRHDRYDPKKGSERQWLFTIARNAALDELRKRKRSAALVVDPEDEAASSAAEEAAEQAERRTLVKQALATLEPADRELVALKFFAGLDNNEIAAVLGISASNAGTKLHRALNKLREAVR